MSRFIFSFFLLLSLPAWAQTAQDTIRTNGIRIGMDVGKIAYYFLTDRTNRTLEVSADVGYKQLLLVAEAGYTDLNQQQPNFAYLSNGLFGRLGVESNLLKGGDDMVFLGGRYGLSQFAYQANRILIEDDYWGIYTGSFPKNSQTVHWMEAVGGVKVNVLGNLFMGFTARMKIKLAESSSKELQPLLIPGFGKATSRTVLGFSYYIFYRIPFQSATPSPPPSGR